MALWEKIEICHLRDGDNGDLGTLILRERFFSKLPFLNFSTTTPKIQFPLSRHLRFFHTVRVEWSSTHKLVPHFHQPLSPSEQRREVKQGPPQSPGFRAFEVLKFQRR